MKTSRLLFVLTFSFLFILTSCNDKNEKEYNLAIKKGDSLFVKKNYERATSFYKQALKLMPKEAHAKDRLKEIDTLLAMKEEEAFQELLLTANDYYDNEAFDEAREVYLQLARLKPNKIELQDRIAAIDAILAERVSPDEPIISNDRPYHIIVGSFVNETNASSLQEVLTTTGFESQLFERPEGFNAVSIHSYSTIHEAYNKMEVDTDGYTDVWVIRQ